MNKEIQKLLNSSKIEDNEKGLKLVRKKGKIDELSLVCNLLNNSQLESLEPQIIDLISNFKDKKGNEIIVNSISKIREQNGNLRAILQACWQSQLDFRQHLALFADIFIDSDYITALEAFTVIENIWIDNEYESSHRELLIDSIKDKLGEMDESKVILAQELILVLEG